MKIQNEMINQMICVWYKIINYKISGNPMARLSASNCAMQRTPYSKQNLLYKNADGYINLHDNGYVVITTKLHSTQTMDCAPE